MNRVVFPYPLYPLAGDVTSVPGNTTVTVTGLENIPLDQATVGAPADGDVITYSVALKAYKAAAGSSIGGSSVAPVQAATTTVLPDTPTYSNGTAGVGATLTAGSNAVLVLDGYTPVLADRILVKNQASGFQNGIYAVTQLGTVSVPYILTRTTDYDTTAQMNAASVIPVINGTVNGVTEWVLTDIIATIGTTALTYAQFTLNPATIATQAGVQAESYTYAADTGAVNAYVVALSPVVTSGVAGQVAVVKIAHSNTGSSTLDAGFGAKTIKKLDGATNLASGDLIAGQIACFVYDGTNWQMQTPTGSAATGAVTSVTASYPLASSGGTTPNLTLNPLVGFIMNDGSTGTNVGPMLTARQAGQVIKCVIVVKASDGSTDLTFKIKQNGIDVFGTDPTITHGTSSGTVVTSTALTTVPLSVAANDVFSIDISSGTSSWKFTAQLE